VTHEEWRELCEKLGLAPWERAGDAGRVGVGEVGRHELRAGIWAGVVPQPWAQLGLDPSLDLGLGGGSLGTEPVPAGHFTVADPRLQDRLWLRADEPERARALLVMRVRDGLFDLLDRRGALRLDDDGMVVEGMAGEEVEFFSAVVPALAGLAASLDEARAGVPPPQALAGQHGPCVTLARERGLGVWETPLRLQGRLGALSLSASTSRIALRSHAFHLFLGFDEPLGLGLGVEPSGLLDSLASLATGTDTRLGDPAFDRAFVVRGRDPERIRRVLPPEVRAPLVAIRERVATITLSDAGLELGGSCRAGDAEGLAWLVRTGSAALEALHESWRRSTGRQAGPYR